MAESAQKAHSTSQNSKMKEGNVSSGPEVGTKSEIPQQGKKPPQQAKKPVPPSEDVKKDEIVLNSGQKVSSTSFSSGANAMSVTHSVKTDPGEENGGKHVKGDDSTTEPYSERLDEEDEEDEDLDDEEEGDEHDESDGDEDYESYQQDTYDESGYETLYGETRALLMRCVMKSKKLPKRLSSLNQALYANELLHQGDLERCKQEYIAILGDDILTENEAPARTRMPSSSSGSVSHMKNRAATESVGELEHRKKVQTTTTHGRSQSPGKAAAQFQAPRMPVGGAGNMPTHKHVKPGGSPFSGMLYKPRPSPSKQLPFKEHHRTDDTVAYTPKRKHTATSASDVGYKNEPTSDADLSPAALKLKNDLVRNLLAKYDDQQREKEQSKKARALAMEEVRQVLRDRGEFLEDDLFKEGDDLDRSAPYRPVAGSADISTFVNKEDTTMRRAHTTSTPAPNTSRVNFDQSEENYETPEKKFKYNIDPMEFLKNDQFIAALKETLFKDSSSSGFTSNMSNVSLDVSSIKTEQSQVSRETSSDQGIHSPMKVVDNNTLKNFLLKNAKKKKKSSKAGDGSVPGSPQSGFTSPSAKPRMTKPTKEQLRSMADQKVTLIRDARPILQGHASSRTFNPLTGKLQREGYQIVSQDPDLENIPSDSFFRVLAAYVPDLGSGAEPHMLLRERVAQYIAENDSAFARAWVMDEVKHQKQQFYSYLQRIESSEYPVDGAQIMMISVMLCRNITVIAAEGVWSTEPTVARDIVVICLGDQQFTAAQVCSSEASLLRSTEKNESPAEQDDQKYSPEQNNTDDTNEKAHSTGSPFITWKCKVCDEIFQTEDDLVAHEPKHVNGVKCSQCTEMLASVHDLIDHVFDVHKITFSCSVCKTTFSKQQNLAKHMQLHNQSYMCDICNQKFPSQEDLSAHANIHLQNVIRCELCNVIVSSQENLLQHMSAAHAQVVFSCNIVNCGKVFTSASSLAQHVATDHKSTELRCGACSSTFVMESEKLKHVRSTHPDFTCLHCTKVFDRKGDKPRHEAACKFNKNREFKCKKCKKPYKGQKAFIEHIKKLHKESVYCEGCFEMFDNDKKLNLHTLKCAVVMEMQNACETPARSLRSKTSN